jgi:hypothetical protein
VPPAHGFHGCPARRVSRHREYRRRRGGPPGSDVRRRPSVLRRSSPPEPNAPRRTAASYSACGLPLASILRPAVYPSWVPRRVVIARSPWQWVLAAIWLSFAALQLPQLFQPVPDYAQHDNFEFFMYYAVPALISACSGTTSRRRATQRSVAGSDARLGVRLGRGRACQLGRWGSDSL